MPMKFSDLARSTKTGLLDLGDGDVIRFEFRQGLVTPRFMHDLYALDPEQFTPATSTEQDAAIMAVSSHVARLVAEWDLLDEDGSMFPLEAERLARDIPFVVQFRLLQRCLAEIAQGEASAPGGSASKPTSGATSSPKGRLARSRHGIR